MSYGFDLKAEARRIAAQIVEVLNGGNPAEMITGSGGRHDNYGFALTAQPGESQRRPATNTSSQLMGVGFEKRASAPRAAALDHFVQEWQRRDSAQAGTCREHGCRLRDLCPVPWA
jgi:hypothetical protein